LARACLPADLFKEREMFDRLGDGDRAPRATATQDADQNAGEAKFQALLESAPDAVVVTDGAGRMVIVNARVEEVFGYRREELIGRAVTLLVPEPARDRHTGHVARYGAEPSTRLMGKGLELSARRKDGTEFPVEISLSPLTLSDGSRLVTAVIRDVRERHALDEARAARTAAEEANRAKDEFLAIVSHELKTPINTVLGWTYLIREHPGNPEILARALSAIERSARVQRRLVDDLLDVGRIVAGTMRVDMAPLDLAAVVEAAMDSLRLAAQSKGVGLESDLAAARCEVVGDTSRLQQVFGNLVSNGVKFTPSGGHIVVRSQRRDHEVEVVVEDTGQGIPSELLPHVFERFRQGQRSATPAGSGLGLGLAIAKDLVERHGGTIAAESPGHGLGSRFTVRLPRRPRA
jgi:PAS domain S-box-containing protein